MEPKELERNEMLTEPPDETRLSLVQELLFPGHGQWQGRGIVVRLVAPAGVAAGQQPVRTSLSRRRCTAGHSHGSPPGCRRRCDRT